MSEKNAAPQANAGEMDMSLESVALVLFAERSRHSGGANVKRIATMCFRDAETFLEVSRGYRPGMAKSAVSDKRADCFAPNLLKTHPHNLVSRQHGDLKRAQRVYEWLKANPLAKTYESDDGLILWKEPEVRLARQLLPEYCEPAKVPATA